MNNGSNSSSWPPTMPIHHATHDDSNDGEDAAPGVSGRHVLPGDSSAPNDATLPALPHAPASQWSIQDYRSLPPGVRTAPHARPSPSRSGGRGRSALLLALGALIGVVAVLLVLGGANLLGQLGLGSPSGHVSLPGAHRSTVTPSPTATATPTPPVLTGSVAPTPATVNLTSEGTLDWAHWGLTGAGDFDHKATGNGMISNASVIGAIGPFQYGSYPISYSWTDGTPTASALNTTTGIYMFGKSNGFTLTVPAGREEHTLLIYVSVFDAQGQLTASLSDHSSPDYSDTSLVNSSANTYGVYTLTYRAASDGQTLTITFTCANPFNIFGNVSLQSAALQ